MIHSTPLRSAACIAALIAGGTANADVTNEDVWNAWKDGITAAGPDVTFNATEQEADNTLIISDIAVTIADESSDTGTIIFGQITFAEQGDGSVLVSLAEDTPIRFMEGGEDLAIVRLSQSAFEMVVSGVPEDLNYDFSADRFVVSVDSIVDPNADVEVKDLIVTANDLSGTYTSSAGDLQQLNYSMRLSSLEMLADLVDTGPDGEYVTFSGKVDGLSGNADIAVPAEFDEEEPLDFLNKGGLFAGEYAIGNANYIFDVNADGEQAAGSLSIGSAEANISADKDGLIYNAETSDVAISMKSSELPFAVDAGLATYGLSFKMPLAQTEEPADFGLTFDLVDLTLGDAIWDMFDAGKVLPRDAATAQIDLAGKAKLLFDPTDPEQFDPAQRDELPAELETFDLNNLRIAAAGALVTGQGGFTFDNSDLETFDGVPRPQGDVTIEINGLNALLDNLVTMGLVPEDQLMGARMMLGMFARTSGDDQLTSTLEINEDGHVLANGQRIR